MESLVDSYYRLVNERHFIETLESNPAVTGILDRALYLKAPNWYLTAGGLFQTVWNRVAGNDPRTGIRDYDFFYFDDSDLSYEAEDLVIRRAAALFDDLGVDVEVRNQARVHLWYEEHFGSAVRPFTSSEDAIDHFVSTTCCFGINTDTTGTRRVYAPHGYDDVYAGVIRPNPRLPMRHVYEAKAARWSSVWPHLTVLPWPARVPQFRRNSVHLRVELFVQDVPASVKFYESLGFESGGAVGADAAYAFVRRGEVRFGLCRANRHVDASMRSVPFGTELVIEVEDVDGECTAAASAGVFIVDPLRDRPWGLRDFRVTDPDGYYLRFTSTGLVNKG